MSDCSRPWGHTMNKSIKLTLSSRRLHLVGKRNEQICTIKSGKDKCYTEKQSRVFREGGCCFRRGFGGDDS